MWHGVLILIDVFEIHNDLTAFYTFHNFHLPEFAVYFLNHKRLELVYRLRFSTCLKQLLRLASTLSLIQPIIFIVWQFDLHPSLARIISDASNKGRCNLDICAKGQYNDLA